jgi:hypothetical protein
MAITSAMPRPSTPDSTAYSLGARRKTRHATREARSPRRGADVRAQWGAQVQDHVSAYPTLVDPQRVGVTNENKLATAATAASMTQHLFRYAKRALFHPQKSPVPPAERALEYPRKSPGIPPNGDILTRKTGRRQHLCVPVGHA